MSALSNAGDRVAALDFARVHESLLRQELDIAVDAKVADLVTRLRAEMSAGIDDQSSALGEAAETSPDGARQSGRDRIEQARSRYLARTRARLSTHFEIEQQTESSSVWTAFLARTCNEGKSVSLRVLNPLAVEAISADDFIAELRQACAVRHRSILSLTDVGAVNGAVYFVCDLPPGVSLRERLESEPQLSISEALSITSDLAAALESAHGRRVLHLNLKPRNIILDGKHAMLQDVGVAHALSAVTADAASQSGLIALGTPAYMSPEQIGASTRLDERSDIYALGCVFYQMLAGAPPFGHAPPSTILSRRLVEPAPFVQRDGLRPKVTEIVMKMLARVPADRFESASALREALADATASR
jgi:serine/threonine protein kinase